ncbi:AfsR/SARP family transcriptional regulator [Amycolatopsis nigrescens]|uniref:AfsR/SARP family transcriptional regulator n=1 Tax=Amycolatopsis nigrescens TaxID=381445 RepID=UPI0003A24477|nr:AfsR/SARP family transcriptional regulator [Amycolatopsis nigrescens]
MQINALGPFEIIRNNADVTPTAPKLRQVCALLALQVNSLVSADQIIEELWQDRPPNSAMTTLQTYVYQLRKLLALKARPSGRGSRIRRDTAAAQSEVTLRTHAGGYMLELDSNALDWYQFEQLVNRGYRQIAGGSISPGVSSLRDGLAIWRGNALSDIGPGSVLRREIVRLEELRKAALEQRIDAELRLGRHQELIGELSVLVAQQPTHEGFSAKLMMALNRTGRRTDALNVYQRARSVLARELGLEPSDELRNLHQTILAGGPGAAAPEPPGHFELSLSYENNAPSADWLPATDAVEIGRQEELSTICAALTSHQPGALVMGGPGSGKTTFALRAAERVRDEFPDGVFYLRMLKRDLAPFQPSELPLELLRVVGVPSHELPAEPHERAGLFRRWVTQHKALLILDDVVLLDQVKAALPAGSTCAVLAVSRRRIYHPALRCTVEMRPVPPEYALRLLTELIGKDRVARDPDGARRLVALCHGSVLGLRAAAARLELRPHWTMSYLAERLGGRPRGLDELLVDGLDIRNSVEANLAMLSEDYRRDLGSMVSGGTAQFTAAGVSSELQMDPHRAEQFLEELVEFQLLETHLPTELRAGRDFEYRCPALVRQVIAETV